MLLEVIRLKDIIKINGFSFNVQVVFGLFFEKFGDFDFVKYYFEKVVLLNSDNLGFLKFIYFLNNFDSYFILYFRNFNEINKFEFYFFVLFKILNINGFQGELVSRLKFREIKGQFCIVFFYYLICLCQYIKK